MPQKRLLLLSIIFLIPIYAEAIKYPALEKWKKAVIHLEAATDNEDPIQKFAHLQEQLQAEKITFEQYREGIFQVKTRDIRWRGTALLIAHKKKTYLLTARHVIFDSIESSRLIEQDEKRYSLWPKNSRPYLNQLTMERATNMISRIIFRVPSLDEIINFPPESPHEFLMNLGTGSPDLAPYTFSRPDIDLAIISLNREDSRLANELNRRGYKPIESKYIGKKIPIEGEEVLTVGFPAATANLFQLNLPRALSNWASNLVSLPAFSFGKVSMAHERLDFFWVDMSVYPGNSGGPIVKNGKLIGIVSAQAHTPIDSVPDVSIRIPFGKIIRSTHILELLRIQTEKDAKWDALINKK